MRIMMRRGEPHARGTPHHSIGLQVSLFGKFIWNTTSKLLPFSSERGWRHFIISLQENGFGLRDNGALALKQLWAPDLYARGSAPITLLLIC